MYNFVRVDAIRLLGHGCHQCRTESIDSIESKVRVVSTGSIYAYRAVSQSVTAVTYHTHLSLASSGESVVSLRRRNHLLQLTCKFAKVNDLTPTVSKVSIVVIVCALMPIKPLQQCMPNNTSKRLQHFRQKDR
jgi:hypothetical protein